MMLATRPPRIMATPATSIRQVARTACSWAEALASTMVFWLTSRRRMQSART